MFRISRRMRPPIHPNRTRSSRALPVELNRDQFLSSWIALFPKPEICTTVQETLAFVGNALLQRRWRERAIAMVALILVRRSRPSTANGDAEEASMWSLVERRYCKCTDSIAA